MIFSVIWKRFLQALEDGQRPLAVRDRRLGGGTIENDFQCNTQLIRTLCGRHERLSQESDENAENPRTQSLTVAFKIPRSPYPYTFSGYSEHPLFEKIKDLKPQNEIMPVGSRLNKTPTDNSKFCGRRTKSYKIPLSGEKKRSHSHFH